MDISKQIEKFIIEELITSSEITSIDSSENLLSKRIIDSMGVVRVATFLEEKFGIQVNDHEMIPQNFKDISSMANYVKSKGEDR